MGPVFASPRPRLRGVSHRIAFHVAIVACTVLVIAAPPSARPALVIYGALLAGMFGVSATLHRADWGPRAFGWLRRADHAMIFACIAGSYTAFCVLGIGLDEQSGRRLLALVWIAAGLGIVRAALWPHAPRAVIGGSFLLVGWVMVVYFPEVRAALPAGPFALLVGGGALFTIGAAIYISRWPDPWPSVFGYHEVFHLMIIVGCACHFIAIARLALSSPR